MSASELLDAYERGDEDQLKKAQANPILQYIDGSVSTSESLGDYFADMRGCLINTGCSSGQGAEDHRRRTRARQHHSHWQYQLNPVNNGKDNTCTWRGQLWWWCAVMTSCWFVNRWNSLWFRTIITFLKTKSLSNCCLLLAKLRPNIGFEPSLALPRVPGRPHFLVVHVSVLLHHPV